MIHRIYYSLLFVLSMINLISCKKDFLDVTGNTQLVYRENYVKDLNSMDEYLNGIYLEFFQLWSGSSYQGYAEYVADNLRPINNANSDRMSKYTWAQNPFGDGNTFNVNNMSPDWRANYRVIRASSFVIEDVDKFRKENNTKADYIKGQAYFFRAIMHFKLVNIFSQPYEFTANASHPGVPYITGSDLSVPYTRQNVRQVYDAIIGDLSKAIELMKATSIADIRYVNADAAKALLARVYLFKSDYSKALELAKEVSMQHPLLTVANGYPDQLFYQQSGISEVLFHATPTDFPNPTSFFGQYLKGFVRYYATTDIAGLLSEGITDIRKNWVSQSGSDWLVTKFPSSAAGVNSVPEGDYYDPVIRSSEMFLTVAEAAAKTGDENTAREYLNAIRKRADPLAADITDSGNQLLSAIYKERRKELCFENFRLYDLQRWKMGINRTDVLPGSPAVLPYPSNNAISPIPKQDIEIMGLSQNEGY